MADLESPVPPRTTERHHALIQALRPIDTLAGRLQYLRTHVVDGEGRPFKDVDVASWCASYSGQGFSKATMSQLVNGKRYGASTGSRVPGYRIQALAAFYRVREADIDPNHREDPEMEITRGLAALTDALGVETYYGHGVRNDLRTLDPANTPPELLDGVRRTLQALYDYQFEATQRDHQERPAEKPAAGQARPRRGA